MPIKLVKCPPAAQRTQLQSPQRETKFAAFAGYLFVFASLVIEA